MSERQIKLTITERLILTYMYKHLGVPSFYVKPFEIIDISNGKKVDINKKEIMQQKIIRLFDRLSKKSILRRNGNTHKHKLPPNLAISKMVEIKG